MPSFNLKTSLALVLVAHHLAIAAPVQGNSKQMDNAFSGSGGNASGGQVYPFESDSNVRTGLLAGIIGKSGLHGLGLVDVLSNNAGDGGHANSGPAVASPKSGTKSENFKEGSHNCKEHNESNSIGNAFSGPGGNASGGSVQGSGALINVLSNNAGDGGEANSGSAGFEHPEAKSRPRRLSSRIMRPRFL